MCCNAEDYTAFPKLTKSPFSMGSELRSEAFCDLTTPTGRINEADVDLPHFFSRRRFHHYESAPTQSVNSRVGMTLPHDLPISFTKIRIKRMKIKW